MARFEVRPGVLVAMRDGVALATDVYLPAVLPAPALLTRTPYDKDLVAAFSDDLDLFGCLRAGYAVVVQDLPEQAAEVHSQLDAYQTCNDLGEHPADVALAWLLSRPAVPTAIVGSRTTEQLTSSLHATDISLNDDTLAALVVIWPGPGQAPEAYAW